MFEALDHVAFVVGDTERIVRLFRDQLGLPVLFSQDLPDLKLRLTHLDAGNAHIQLIEPQAEHPLAEHHRQHGDSVHHICFRVKSVPGAIEELSARGVLPREQPRPAPGDRTAAFLDPATTQGIWIELLSLPSGE